MSEKADSHSKHIVEVEGGSVVSPAGFSVSGIYSGVKRKRNDLGVLYSDVPAQAAAVYTLNLVQAAPLKVTKEALAADPTLQAIIVNSGNANACTGEKGLADAYEMQALIADHLQIPKQAAAVASTGIIGLEMPMDKISANIPNLQVGNSPKDAENFGQSLLTTDTFNKYSCFRTEINGSTVTMGGAAKGSGMIEPNMGTMLGFITTDANVPAVHLRAALKEITEKTFNCITVDGDTSTNDMVVVLANGKADKEALTPDHPDWIRFIQLLELTCQELAKAIARDGEGATKLIEVAVSGATSDDEAKKVAKAIVGSSLVKTAAFGTDANWGRIIAAVGYSGAAIDPDKIDMRVGPITLLEKSVPVNFSEEEATAYLENDTIEISVHLHQGKGHSKAWGCDLTYDYVRINASYRT